MNWKNAQIEVKVNLLIESIVVSSSFHLMAPCSSSQTFLFLYREHKVDDVCMLSLLSWNSWSMSYKLISLYLI